MGRGVGQGRAGHFVFRARARRVRLGRVLGRADPGARVFWEIVMLATRSGLYAASLLLTGFGAPAMAQSALCGGLGDGAPWLGETQAGSDIANVPVPLSWAGAVAPGTRAVALFTLGAPMTVRIEATADDPAGDTLVELFDDTGRLVVIDDDSGGMLASRAEPELEAGLYCVAMMGFGGEAVRGRMQVSRLEMAALTPGLAGGFAGMDDDVPFVGIEPCLPDTPATLLGEGAVDALVMGGLSATGSASDSPYFRFSLASPQSLSVRAENVDADPYLYVFDGQGRLLGENDDFDTLDSRVDFVQPLPAGEYCIGLRALWDDTLPITVSISAQDARSAAVAGYAMGEIAPPLDGSWPVENLGLLPPQTTRDWQVPGDQAQWFVMDVPNAGLLLITADEISDSDPVISLFDASGVLLGMNDDANETINSQLALPVTPGRYILAVRQFEAEYKGMIRIGVSRYELARQ